MEQYDRATKNEIVFEWLVFDEGYGGKPEFLRQLDARDQLFIGEVDAVPERDSCITGECFRNVLATFCHRCTKRKRMARRGFDLATMHRCKWT